MDLDLPEASPTGRIDLGHRQAIAAIERIIARRLRLPSFPRWRQKHRALREAQKEPTHWGFGRTHPIVPWAARLEPGDLVVVLGAAALAEALFLAAHDAEVFLLDQDLGAVEAAVKSYADSL